MGAFPACACAWQSMQVPIFVVDAKL